MREMVPHSSVGEDSDASNDVATSSRSLSLAPEVMVDVRGGANTESSSVTVLGVTSECEIVEDESGRAASEGRASAMDTSTDNG